MNVNSHGIGLSYCKRVAKSLGGDLLLNEAIRDGCEFVLNLTLKKLDAPAEVINFFSLCFQYKKKCSSGFNRKFGKKIKQKPLLKVIELDKIHELPEQDVSLSSPYSEKIKDVIDEEIDQEIERFAEE